jgi:endoglucanase
MTNRHLAILRTILSQPVSPFHEEGVVACVRQWAQQRGVDFSQDQAGNVVLRYRRGRGGRGRGARPTWVFTAHMDHPGFVARRQAGGVVWAEFRGGVDPSRAVGTRVRFYFPGGQAAGVITSRKPMPGIHWWTCRVKLDAPADVPPGCLGMWDLPAFRVRGTRVTARACDDLAGTAAVLCVMDQLAADGAEADVMGLLTRAEEAGFVGALAACRLGTIPADAWVVGIEASKALPPAAAIGGGAILRVGDKTRTFDATLDAHLTAVAGRLSKVHRDLHYVRQLMSGGTCESTVYCAYGFRAAAVAVPLGNYHNMGPGKTVRAEQIDLRDFASLVALLAALPTEAATPADTDAKLHAMLDGIYAQRGRFLEEG